MISLASTKLAFTLFKGTTVFQALTTISSNMTIVSNDPSWWPLINWSIIFSYFVVASSVAMSYDWALTLGQEIELIWMQRWSHMTILYLGVRYGGILTFVINMLASLPSVSLTDAG